MRQKIECLKCGRCCSPKFLGNGYATIFLSKLRCKYLTDDNLCSIYDRRKEIRGDTCLTLDESRIRMRPVGCAFGGTALEIDYTVQELLDNAQDSFYGLLVTGLYQWRS